MYDIEFIIPVSDKNKYNQRLEDLYKIGLINHSNKKILLTLLVGTEKITPKPLGDNIDVNIVTCTYNHCAAKVYDYFANLTPIQATRANWVAKIDDDSVNDVESLVDGLNDMYSCDLPFYLVTKVMFDMHKVEFDILNKLGHGKIWEKSKTLQHEHEGCVLSRKAMEIIYNNKDCIELFNKRSKIEDGYSDQCLGAACRIVKIYPIKSPILASENESIVSFTTFGGPVAHLHPLSHDKTPAVYQLFKTLTSNKDNRLKEKLCDKEYFLVHINQNKECVATHIYLDKRGILYKPRFIANNIHKEHLINEVFWTVSDDKYLNLFFANGQQATRFDCSNISNEIYARNSSFIDVSCSYLIYSKIEND